MDFFISNAWAENGVPAEGGFMGLLFPVLLLVVFFFLFIRPQQKRAKEHKNMISELKKGDEVVTVGGLAGTITKVGDAFIAMQVADGIEVSVQKQHVGNLLPKGTLKSA